VKVLDSETVSVLEVVSVAVREPHVMVRCGLSDKLNDSVMDRGWVIEFVCDGVDVAEILGVLRDSVTLGDGDIEPVGSNVADADGELVPDQETCWVGESDSDTVMLSCCDMVALTLSESVSVAERDREVSNVDVFERRWPLGMPESLRVASLEGVNDSVRVGDDEPVYSCDFEWVKVSDSLVIVSWLEKEVLPVTVSEDEPVRV
jgi:hypothetical protein